jgi:hypothetical protein
MSEAARPPGGDRRPRQVVDPGHRCNYSQVPHLLLDDSAAGLLHPAAIVLLLHYMRATFEQHGRPVDETLRETKQRTGLSNGTILTAREELEKMGWLTVEKDGNRGGQSVTITLTERWENNCERHGHLGQKLTKSEELGRFPAKVGQKPAKVGRKLTKSHLNGELLNTLEDIEDPLGVVDVDGADRVSALEPQLPGMLTEVPPQGESGRAKSRSFTAEELLEGFYRDGLGGDPARDLAAKQRDRELDSARDLLVLGATPAQVAAWARETIAGGRITFITLATLVKAWPGWRAARRRPEPMALARGGYLHDPFQGGRPPIAEADLVRGSVL